MVFKSKLIMHFQIATAMLHTFSQGYNFKKLRSDLWAGFLVALIALPLCMSLSIAVGLRPENAVYSAIFAGILVPLLGGSMTQVTGPTAAFVVVVAPIVTDLGSRGIIWCQILAGILLIIMGFSRLGKYINFVPYSVTTGFSAGIAVVIFVIAMNNFLGLNLDKYHGDVIMRIEEIIENINKINYAEFGVGLITLMSVGYFSKLNRFFPSTVIGVTIGTVIAFILSKNGHDVATIKSAFTFTQGIEIKQGMPSTFPKFNFPNLNEGHVFEIPSLSELKTFMMPAIVIAALASLESLLSATVADSMSGTKHKSNVELKALGVGNVIAGFVLGTPATGAVARTSSSITYGAKTPFAAIFHALFILLFLMTLTPIINEIPMASLSAILIVTAYRFAHFKRFYRMFSEAPKGDVVVLIVCFLLIVFVDMISGLTVGIMLASLLFMKSVSEMTDVKLEAGAVSDDAIVHDLPASVMVYNIDGPLFFGSVQKAYGRSDFLNEKIKTVVFNMEHVPYIDISGLMAIKSIVRSLIKKKRRIILVANEKILAMILRKTGASITISTSPYVETTHTMLEAASRLKTEDLIPDRKIL